MSSGDHHPSPIAAALGKMHLWSNFVTPTFEARSFDARFYVYCCESEDQIVYSQSGAADHDGEQETIDVAWMSPRAALHQVEEGSLFLPPPQVCLQAGVTASCLQLLTACCAVVHYARNGKLQNLAGLGRSCVCSL